MSAVIIDYGSGNLHSVHKALQSASATLERPIAVEVTSDADAITKASHIVLPGVGAYRDCWNGLAAADGVLEALREAVEQQGKPFLGICVGMQMMARAGFEHGETAGLGWIDGVVKAIAPNDPQLKIPHMGWNTLQLHQPHPLFEGLPMGEQGLHAYFVHSYAFADTDKEQIIATTSYGGEMIAAVGRDTVFGTQFHPEKSQSLGLGLLNNFLRWKP